MPKNLFEDLAIEQEREHIAKIKILTKLKNNDIKGAHRLAKPWLEKLKEREEFGGKIPTGWIKISQALCALDIEDHGISKATRSNYPPTDANWIRTALELVGARIKGIVKAIVPATMVIALLIQVLQPIVLKAQNTISYGTIPDKLSLTVEDITGGGKLTVTAKSEIRKDEETVTKPELCWTLKAKSTGNLLEDSGGKLLNSSMMKEGKGEASINWELADMEYLEGEDAIEIRLRATNSSQTNAIVQHLSMSESEYGGCTIELPNNVAKEYNQYRSPSEIPAGGSATYQLKAAKESLPIVMFRTEAGETHSMLIKLPTIENLLKSKEKKTCTTYQAINDSYQDVTLKLDTPKHSELTSIKVDNKRGSKSYLREDIVTLHPGSTIEIQVVSDPKKEPELYISSQSRDGNREYVLSSSESKTIREKLIQKYEMILKKIIWGQENYLSWDNIKTDYDKNRTALIELTDEIPSEGSKLMSTSALQSMEEALKTEKIRDLVLKKEPLPAQASKKISDNRLFEEQGKAKPRKKIHEPPENNPLRGI